jgi:outer membrane protein TolC
MATDMIRTASLALLCSALSACSAHTTASDLSSVRALVKDRAHIELAERRERDPEAVDPDVSALAAHGLTLDNAIRIALLNNRELRAELYDLGVARGQLVQAELFPNLDFDAQLRFPEHKQEGNEWDLGASIDLTQLILRGPRRDVMTAQLMAARARAAGAALDLGYRVRLAYYDVQAAQQQLELMHTVMDALAASYDTSRELHKAGNVSDLDVSNEQSAYESARVAVAEADADVVDARERLNVLLGFFGRDTTWQLSQRLPDPTTTTYDTTRLESRAIQASLELEQTRQQLMAATGSVGLSELSGWLPDVSVGVSAERLNREWAVGPAIHGSLPVFNRQQGATISRRAELDALRERYVGEAIEIRAAVRAARAHVESAEARARQYHDTLLPLRERVVKQTTLQYNAMQIGVFQLLTARREQAEAGRNYVATLLEYWKARATLEQLLAGRETGTIANLTPPSVRRSAYGAAALSGGMGH